MRATVSGPCALQRKEAACGQETLGNLGGGNSTFGVQEGLLVLVVSWRIELWDLKGGGVHHGCCRGCFWLWMTPILMSILVRLLEKLSLLDLLVLQLLSGLDSTGIAGSVAPCAAGREKGLHVVQAKRQALHGETDFVCYDARVDSSLPTVLPERGEAHEVDLVADAKVSQAFVECGDCVVTLPLSLGRDCRCCNISCRNVGLDKQQLLVVSGDVEWHNYFLHNRSYLWQPPPVRLGDR